MKFAGRSLRVIGGSCFFAALCITFADGCGNDPNEKGREPAVTLRWEPGASTVAGYNVYRASPPGVPVKLTNQILADTKFVDRSVEPGYSYSYFVTAVGSEGLESIPSARADIKVPRRGIADALLRFFSHSGGAPSNAPVP